MTSGARLLTLLSCATALQRAAPPLRPSSAVRAEDKAADNGDSLGRRHFIREIIETDLKEKKHGQIVTRFPPEPNGFLHLGHAKSMCVNFGLASDYGGRAHMRLDDTNPEKENRVFGDAILEDVRWLVGEATGPQTGNRDPWYGNVRHASDYFDVIYAAAKALVARGDAYVDSQSAEAMRETRGTLTKPGSNSPFRDRSPAENLELLERMRNGAIKEGEAVLRAKIDMASPNLNLRDPALYRVKAGTPHPRTADDWRIYPMYDFAHAISDSMEGITHSLCTLEFEDHRPLYDWVVDRCPEVRDAAWVEGVYRAVFEDRTAAREAPPDPDYEVEPRGDRPRQIEFSRLNVAHTLMSKRKLAKLVEDAAVDGWDDPRLPTLAALRRKGVPPAALRLFCERVGVSKADSSIDPELVDDAVREVLDASAPRAMGVLRPLKVTVTNWPADGEDERLDAPRHPKDEALGKRERLRFGSSLVIERADFHDPETDGAAPAGFNRLVAGGRVRLRYAYVLTCDDVVRGADGAVEELRCTASLDTRAGARGDPGIPRVKGIIHWLRADDAVPVTVRLYDKLFASATPGEGDDALNPKALEVLEDALLEKDALDGLEHRGAIQLERVGYFCADAPGSPAAPGALDASALVLNRVAPLKDTFAGEKRASAKKQRGGGAPKKQAADATADLPPELAAAAKLELLVGTVTSAEPHEGADALFKTWVDCGEAEARTVGAGLRAHYGDAAELVGARVLVLSNTKPRNLAGFKSAGMLLCSTDADGATALLRAPEGAKNGDRATFAGLPDAAPATPNQMNNKKLWQTAQPALTTSGGGVVVADFALSVGGEAVVADAADGASVA